MSVSQENGSLVLNTNWAGTTSNNKTKCTWTNINLRSLLQGMYDKYDAFNICLNTVTTGTATNAGTTANDKNVIIYVSGLPFISQCYSTKTNTITSASVMGSFTYPADTSTTAATQYFYSSNIATFNKSCDMVNITIELIRVIDDATPTTANPFPDSTYIFDIYGVDTRPLIGLNAISDTNNARKMGFNNSSKPPVHANMMS